MSDEVFSTWMTFRGNTERGDDVASIKQRRCDLQSDGVKDFVMALEHSRLKEDLESSTWRWRHGLKETRILSVLLEITPDLDTRAIRTPLSSLKGTIWCLCDPTPSDWYKMDAHSTNFASNWLERLPVGSISTWEYLTTRFLAQLFPLGRTAKLLPHHGIDLWLQVQIFYDNVNPATRRTIDQSADGKLRDRNAEESWALLEDLALYDNESWNVPRDFTKPVKAISLPQDVPSTFDRRLIKLENQVQRLMEAHLAPKQPIQVNKITSSCEICSSHHDTQYCMENPKQAFVEYASSRIDET
ncbi:hypothetical protein Tco_0503691 [Tanacetum coccineum]